MRYLIDTHIFVWQASADHKFPFYTKQGLDLIYNKL